MSDSLQPHELQHCQASLSSIFEFAQIHMHWVSDAIQPSHPLLPPFTLDLNFPQHRGFFKWIGSLHQVATYWNFSFSISPYSEYLGLISFGIDWFDFLAIQGTLEPSLASQFESINFFGAQPSLWFKTHICTGKTTALTAWTFVSKVTSLFFNMVSRFIIAFLPRNKHLSWLQSPSAEILETEKIKCHCFHFSPFYLPWSDGTRCHDCSSLNVEF